MGLADQTRIEREAMADDPLKTAQVEIICRRCDYHMVRTANRLRRSTDVVCPNCGAVVVREGREQDETAN